MSKNLIDWLFNSPRSTKRLVQVTVDIAIVLVSLILAMTLRLDGFQFMRNGEFWIVAAIVTVASPIIFNLFGFYNSVVRFFSQASSLRPFISGIGLVAVLLLVIALSRQLGIPRSVPFIFALLLSMSVLASRFVVRLAYLTLNARDRVRILIYGAGTSGRQLMQTLSLSTDYLPVGFVDRDPSVHGLRLGALKIHPPTKLPALIKELGANMILLAIPSASRNERANILRQLSSLSIKVQTIPGIEDLVSGKARVTDMREVDVNDLLGRDPVPPLVDLLSHDIVGKNVLVTGAGGSIGSEICRQIIRLGPDRLVLFELSELALYQIEHELRQSVARLGQTMEIVPILGSVQGASPVKAALARHSVQTVYHAAAYKHVPLVEVNVVEGVRNNVLGTLNLARQCQAEGVEAFILVSTDKAVRPTNVMGATKRVAELICQAFAHAPTLAPRTRFSIVRFGNVLGSSGSVIPLFRQQIAAGGPVTVTDPEVTRYFMTIPEASMLVIQSGALAKGGDVFLLNMGEPVRITELAKQMISQSGFTPVLVPPGHDLPDDLESGQIAICFTGLRLGEKLYEELLIDDEGEPTRHPDIIRGKEPFLPLSELEPKLAELRDACEARDAEKLVALLKALPIDFIQTDNGAA